MMNRRITSILSLLLLTSLVAAGCGGSGDDSESSDHDHEHHADAHGDKHADTGHHSGGDTTDNSSENDHSDNDHSDDSHTDAGDHSSHDDTGTNDQNDANSNTDAATLKITLKLDDDATDDGQVYIGHMPSQFGFTQQTPLTEDFVDVDKFPYTTEFKLHKYDETLYVLAQYDPNADGSLGGQPDGNDKVAVEEFTLKQGQTTELEMQLKDPSSF